MTRRVCITAVNSNIYSPIANFVRISLHGETTLLDTDIAIIDSVDLDGYWSGKTGRSPDGSLFFNTKDGSDDIREMFARRRREFTTLLHHGKIIFAFLSPVKQVEAQVRGSIEYSTLTNYDWLPLSETGRRWLIGLIEDGTGSGIRLADPSHPVAPYYKAFKDCLSYSAYLAFDPNDSPRASFLVNKTDNPVGLYLTPERGHLVFLPSPPPDDHEKLIGVLIQCAKPLLTGDSRTPAPEWTAQYEIPGVEPISHEIAHLDEKIELLNVEKEELEVRRDSLKDYLADSVLSSGVNCLLQIRNTSA